MTEQRILTNLRVLHAARAPIGTVVTAPGWNCGSEHWKPIAESLVDRGMDVVLHDRSEAYVDIGFTRQGYFRKIAVELAVFCGSEGIQNPVVLGHSMGAHTAFGIVELANMSGFEWFMPSGLALVTPVTEDPRATLPDSGLIGFIASRITKLEIGLVINAIENHGMPGESGVERSLSRLRLLYYTFGLAGPRLLRAGGASEVTIDTFNDFIADSWKVNPNIGMQELYAMCIEGRRLKEVMLAQTTKKPKHVLMIGAGHDLMVDAGKAYANLEKMFGRKALNKGKVMFEDLGHFPHQEDRVRFVQTVYTFLSEAFFDSAESPARLAKSA